MAVQFTRIAVKIGSNVLARKDGTLDVTRMSALVDQVAELRKAGVEVILISSGAVASGRSEIKPSKKLDSVEQRQLFSAVGQAKLINRYYELFREHGIPRRAGADYERKFRHAPSLPEPAQLHDGDAGERCHTYRK